MKKDKIIKKSILFAIFIYIVLNISPISFAGTLSSDINGMDDKKYPGIKSAIQDLQRKHSNYNFQIYYTGIDWTEAITMEYQGHGKSPKNLFSYSDKYKGKWYCPICGSTKYDTGWYCASIDAIKYMMDPRNSFDETSIFQFKNLEASDVTADNITQVINSKYASYAYINNPTTISAIVKASEQNTLNGYSIVAKIINEQGSGNSPLISGNGYQGQYIGYYNFFNVGAYGSGRDTVILKGLSYAQSKGWNSVESSILGGSAYYKSSYIGRGQNTLYYQRFNVVDDSSLFSHQYQQDIMGAQTSATLLKSYYTISGTLNTISHTFIIPVYENMPTQVCSRPSTAENHMTDFEQATILTDKTAVRAAPNSSRIVGYLNKNEKVRVIERANKPSSDGNYWDIIASNTDGTYGYVIRTSLSKKNNYPTFVFDYQYYADTYSDLKAKYGYNEAKLYDHFVTEGIKEGKNSSPVFNAKYYVEANPDLAVAFGTDYLAGCEHFMKYGCYEGRRSSPEYDGTFYQYYNLDLSNLTAMQLIQHYLTYGRAEGRLAGLPIEAENSIFDPIVYAEGNPDLKAAYGNNEGLLRKHWLMYGIREGRMASLLYSPEFYGLLNPDVQNAFGNNPEMLLLHFVKNGISEGRTASFVFDLSYYLALNSDVKNAYGSNYQKVYQHFSLYGAAEGRQSSHVFDAKTYLESNADLKNAYGNNYKLAYIHFANYGVKEDRNTSPNFDITYYKTYRDLNAAYRNNNKQYYMHYLLYGRAEGRRAK